MTQHSAYNVLKELGGTATREQMKAAMCQKDPHFSKNRNVSSCMRGLVKWQIVSWDEHTKTYTIIADYPETITVSGPITEDDIIDDD